MAPAGPGSKLGRATLAFAAALAALIAALFPEVVTGRGFLFDRDLQAVCLAQWEVFVRSVAQGAWPIWDPTVAFGQPMLAVPNTQILYPFTWLHLVLRSHVQYSIYVVAHLAIAGAGLYRFSRRLRFSRAAASVAALFYVGSGPLLSLVNVWHHFAGACWLPFILHAADRAFVDRRRRDALVLGAFLALQLVVGSPDLLIFTGALVAAWGMRHLDFPRLFSADNRRLLGAAGLALLFAAALGAAQWLPTLEVLGRAHIQARTAYDRGAWSVHPTALVQILLPVSFEDLPVHSAPEVVPGLFDLWSPFVASLHLGIAGLALVLAALAGPRRPHRLFLSGLAVFATLFALGSHTFVHGVLAAVPPLNLVRYPSKGFVVAALAWALLAGLGFDSWCEEGALRARRAAAAIMGVACLGAVLAALAAWGRGPVGLFSGAVAPRAARWVEILAASPVALAVSAMLALIALAAYAASAWGRPRSWLRWVAAGAAVAELAFVHRGLNPTIARDFFALRPEILKYLRAENQPRLYVFDYRLHATGHEHAATKGLLGMFLRVPTSWPRPVADAIALQAYLYPPIGGRWGLRGSYDNDLLGLYPKDLFEMVVALRGAEETPAFLRLLQLGGVDFVVALHTEGLDGVLEPAAIVRGYYPRPIQLFRVPETLPHAYLVGGAQIASGPAAFQALIDPGFNPRREVMLSQGAPQAAADGYAGTAVAIDSRSDRLVFDVESNAPGHLVVLDSYDPGWKASVDGAPAPLLPANLIFRAVPVTAGRHRVEMVYRPRALLVGLALSGVSVLVGLALLLRRIARPTTAP